MYKIVVLLLFVFYYCSATTMAQTTEKLGNYTFIKYDSIPMCFVDTMQTFSGKKFAAKELTPRDSEYYYPALTPPYLIGMRRVDWRIYPFEERVKIKCFEVNRFDCINYLAILSSDTVLIDSGEKFREIFAPVDSPREAIAFAYIFTDAQPIYNLDFLRSEAIRPREDPNEPLWRYTEGSTVPTLRKIIPEPSDGWEIYRPTVSSSYAKEVEDGYEVLLYDKDLNSIYSECLIKVYFDGTVKLLREEGAFGLRGIEESIE